jgi:hypothetical protein
LLYLGDADLLAAEGSERDIYASMSYEIVRDARGHTCDLVLLLGHADVGGGGGKGKSEEE